MTTVRTRETLRSDHVYRIPQTGMQPTTRLWASVLAQALRDVSQHLPEPAPRNADETAIFYSLAHEDQLDAAVWFESESRAVGSLNWICEALGLSASAVRREVKRRIPVEPRWWGPT